VALRVDPANGIDRSWAEDEVAPEWDRLTGADGLVARRGNEIVGHAWHRDGELTWLWVDLHHRHTGVATALVAAIDGSLRVRITNDDLGALRFFQRRGFRLTGARIGVRGLDGDGYYGIRVRDQLHLARVGRGSDR